MTNYKFFSLAIGMVALSLMAPTPVFSAPLEEIQERGKLIVAVKDNLRPLGFRGKDGNLQGLEIDLAKRLAQELLGKPDAVVLQPVTNLERLNVVLQGKVDLAIARVTTTNSRLRLVYLSAPYYVDGTGLVTKDTSIKQLSDLATKKIAVLNTSSTIAVVRHNLPKAKLVGVKSYEEARARLENSEIDAFAADKSILSGWVQEYPEYKLLPERLSAEALCVVIPKGVKYSKLQLQVNAAIARLTASGWLAQRVAAWGLP